MYEQKPWLKFYGQVPHTLEYPRVSMYEAVRLSAAEHLDEPAYDFLGHTSTYRKFMEDIDHCADALAAIGVKKDDRVTISMPTSPQGIICFYAVNKLGAVSSMIHPLSPAKEIEFYLNVAKSKFALTLDAFYSKFKEVKDKTPLEKLILARIPDYLPPLKRIGFNLTMGRKIPKVPKDPMVIWWRDLMRGNYPPVPKVQVDTDDLAVILYSGGTTGVPKGIMLSNMNFISEGKMVSNGARWAMPILFWQFCPSFTVLAWAFVLMHVLWAAEKQFSCRRLRRKLLPNLFTSTNLLSWWAFPPFMTR